MFGSVRVGIIYSEYSLDVTTDAMCITFILCSDGQSTETDPLYWDIGFPVNYRSNGQRQMDKMKVACWHYSTELGYDAGGTPNMIIHLTYPNVKIQYEETTHWSANTAPHGT